jgi:sulfoxide reductase heme-binding subunit YedZ
MNAQLTDAMWYLGRGSGLVALVMLTVVMVLGILTRSRRRPADFTTANVTRLHRNAGMLSVVFLAVHVVTLLADPYAQLRLVDAVLPFAGAHRPFYLGLGTLSLDLLAAVLGTSLLMKRVGAKTWRAVHWLSYACWPTAFLHGLGDGTDTDHSWALGLSLVCFAAVGSAVVWRLSDEFVRTPVRRSAPTGVPLAPAPSAEMLPVQNGSVHAGE